MRRRASSSTRVLPDGTPLRNRLLAALPADVYKRVATHLRLQQMMIGGAIHEDGRRIDHVYFPNGGVFSVTNQMRDGTLVEVATVGREGMLGVGVFLGDRAGTGRTFQQVADGPVVALAVAIFLRETATRGTISRADGALRAGELVTSDAVRRLQRAPRRHAALLPLAAADTRSCGRRRLCVEARVPGRDARRAPSHGNGRFTRAARERTDFEPLWTSARTQAPTARSDVVRVLRSHPAPFRSAWTVPARGIVTGTAFDRPGDIKIAPCCAAPRSRRATRGCAQYTVECRERVDDVGERRQWSAQLDRQYQLTQNFARTRGHQRRANQHTACAIADQFDRAAVKVVDVASRRLARMIGGDDDVDAYPARGRLGQSD